ncbi:MAG: 16S rRNA (uracil(1498)-N(3))-methyltransferase [Acidimicrobiia bacterium]|nr:16S rRNA (uracil(1498)-N(3))-methyltransferase [Acidimicrobiia bacterium]
MASVRSVPLGGPDGQGGPHVFVDDLARPVLTSADRHHLEKVVRMRAGDPLTASDGRGGWRPCRFGDPLEVSGEVQVAGRRSPEITIAFTPVKGDRPEWVVQKLTELGVDTIVVLRTERSVVRWDDERAVRQLERFRRIAHEAAMQCRRCHLPEVEGVLGVAEVAGWPGVARADMGGRPAALGRPVVLIGPEGGWTDAECELVPDAIGLGDYVLRAETAALAAATVLTAQRGGSTLNRDV